MIYCFRFLKIIKKSVWLFFFVKFDVGFKLYKNNILNSFLLATVYRQLKKMSYMDVAGRENIHVTINDAVMHALKTVRDNFVFTSLDILNYFLFLACYP